MTKKAVLNERQKAFRSLLKKNKLDGFVLTNSIDQLYLLGFPFYPEEAVVVFHPKGISAFIRTLYLQPFGKVAPQVRSFGEDKDRVAAAVEAIKELKLKNVGFDAAKESYYTGKVFSQNGFIETEGFVGKLREQKDNEEYKVLRASNRIAYEAYEYIRPRVKTGMTENELGAELERFMRLKGALSTSFYSIVCFGENTANPHHQSSDRKLKAEEPVLIDFGCLYHNYCSDITRSWWHGKKEPAEYTKIWKIVEKARKAGIKTAKAGVKTKEVDGASRGVIEAAGYGEFFTHRTGHGVGLEIHELPNNSADSPAVLAEGNVVTVEPGIYLPEKFGVRLEDTIFITKTGNKILTKK